MKKDIQLTTSDQHSLNAYEHAPTNASAGLVVLQEIFGVNPHIRQMCDKFAAQGYHVISPALFDRVERNISLGYEPEDMQRGLNIRAKISPEKTLLDVIAAAEHFPYDKIGIVGYCWGGSLSWKAATETKLFSAASCWYGAMIPSLLDRPPHCPVQMHFGELDHSIPLDAIDKIRQAYKDNSGVDIYVYKNAEHGFGCQARSSFNPEAYELAQQRTLDLFAKNL
ncbi:Dienelactone hydrolase (DLH) (PDB:4ZV9) [Commensalibacter communis]|uniref:dienelactone hydrolase family protein n=1 Tax=Commensalibacter communis TaxID=2972786 RepID=UPI0022FF98E1|nr:dienelactone hydrolase family protein [Commensalibacter communis]CAI3946525.1 Dienelactone hydrolase (DLH) (PDB:4ZV9) [Commensalibacter communis]CAI3947838.1 Dienelactone hydrolase (DLH) (PDB:4ZV9) [Commensalibacter communis]